MNVSCFVQFKMLASCIFLLIYVCSLVSYSSCLFSWLCWCVMMWSLKMHDYWLTPTVRQYKYRYNSKLKWHNSKKSNQPFSLPNWALHPFSWWHDLLCCVIVCVCDKRCSSRLFPNLKKFFGGLPWLRHCTFAFYHHFKLSKLIVGCKCNETEKGKIFFVYRTDDGERKASL